MSKKKKAVKLPTEKEIRKLSKADLFAHLNLTGQVFQEINDDKNVKRMRKASGKHKSDRLLVGFLYLLMRDSVTPGQLEFILLQLCDNNDEDELDELLLTNGWLAQYAEDIADRLTANKKSDKKHIKPTEKSHSRARRR